MRVMVGVKRVIDFAVKVKVSNDLSGVDLSNVKFSINPFCEIAVEEAVQLKEKQIAKEVIVVSIGPKASQETLRTALAIGADRAIHVLTDIRIDQDLPSLIVAKILKSIVLRENPHLVLLGKQSIDGDNCQTAAMLAGLLDWPQITCAAKLLDFSNNHTLLRAHRETDTGIETIESPLPAIVSCDLRLNTPRYCSLPNIMKAKKKTIEEVQIPEELLRDIRLKTISVAEPAKRSNTEKCYIASDAADLIEKLRNKAKVI